MPLASTERLIVESLTALTARIEVLEELMQDVVQRYNIHQHSENGESEMTDAPDSQVDTYYSEDWKKLQATIRETYDSR